MRNGWVRKKLSAVSAINYGYTERASSEPVGPHFLRITDIQDDNVDWAAVPYCAISSADAPKYRLKSGDIVFARTGATTGKSFLVIDPPDSVFASYLIRLRLIDRQLLPQFLSLFFQTASYWQAIKDGSSGSAQGGFNATKLGALRIPVPPLAEQQRIVGILDEAFAGIATAEANVEKNLQNACALFESHLHSVFTRRTPRWVETTIGEICNFRGGGTPSKAVERYWNGKIPWVSPKDMKSEVVFDSIDHISQEAIDGSATSLIPKGAVLMVVRSGILARTVPIAVTGLGVAINQDLKALCPKSVIESRFLYSLLESKMQELLSMVSRGATVHRLMTEQVRTLKCFLPPKPDQNRIVEKVETMRTETQRLAAIFERKLAALKELKKSLLHQAFTGKL